MYLFTYAAIICHHESSRLYDNNILSDSHVVPDVISSYAVQTVDCVLVQTLNPDPNMTDDKRLEGDTPGPVQFFYSSFNERVCGRTSRSTLLRRLLNAGERDPAQLHCK